MRCCVKLRGHPEALDFLCRSKGLKDIADVEVIKDPSHGYLLCFPWNTDIADTAEEGLEYAKRLSTIISSLLRIYAYPEWDISVDNLVIQEHKGTYRTFVLTAPAATVKAKAGIIPTALENRLKTGLCAGLTLPGVSEDFYLAMYFRDKEKETLSWFELYKVYEIIEHNVDRKEIIKRGWATGKKLERFTRTANSRSAAGVWARHGVETSQPPPNPMSLLEARKFIDKLLEKWIDSLCPES